VREVAHRFGGSHAQREAAFRGGHPALASALAAERAAIRPHSPITPGFIRRAQALNRPAA
jgi:hypothetical protein